MLPSTLPQVETHGPSPAAFLFHSLSDPTRLAILRHLSLGEHRVVELTGHLSLCTVDVSSPRTGLASPGRADRGAGTAPAGPQLPRPRFVLAIAAASVA
ncbi:Transcriptional regulator, ArsR family (fragment) [Modestobacter italicus]|uniref:Transcriptional regulator, ArsR family n=1 Tax=Modestobacter italicus (strain DSM 44449 / CECT 9708 / BC 501) TaxID=2732864 RepID=I4EUP5_MODI5